MLPLFAPLKRSKQSVSMSFWKDGSSIPIGIVDSQHKSRYFSFVPLKTGWMPQRVLNHYLKAVVFPVPESPNAIGTGQFRYFSRITP